MIAVLALAALFASAAAVEPTVNCPAPRSPEHGQAFLYQEGKAVKYVCEPGYALQGREIIHCADGEWEEPSPLCVEMKFGRDPLETPEEPAVPPPPMFPSRPLFSWGDNDLEQVPEPEPEPEPERNSTGDDGDEAQMSDEARYHRVIYPRRRIITRRYSTARLQSGTELEEEEKRRSANADASTTIHLQAPPSLIYVRRTQKTGKSDDSTQQQIHRAAPLHLAVENNDNGETVQVVSMPRAAVSQNDKGVSHSEQALRNMYWWAANEYYYPRQASSMVDYYYHSGYPVGTTLSESQINWINSLHPELRDQYLKDIYRSGNYYNLYYHTPVQYYRRPMSLVVDPISSYDYSCHQAHSSFVKAPKLPNAHIARYDRRQNPNPPNNHYLTAVYRCNPGFVMLDTHHTELHCSNRGWAGTLPVCVRS